MAFTKTTWVDGSNPAITAAQLNRIEAGIADIGIDTVSAAGVADSVANGGTTLVRKGVHHLLVFSGSGSASQLQVQAQISGLWVDLPVEAAAGVPGASAAVVAMVVSDGVNVRVRNTTGGTATIRFLTMYLSGVTP